MAIYTRWGHTITLVAKCGKHLHLNGGKVKARLVMVEENGHDGFEFLEFLRADGGLSELESTHESLKTLDLRGESLTRAIEIAS